MSEEIKKEEEEIEAKETTPKVEEKKSNLGNDDDAIFNKIDEIIEKKTSKLINSVLKDNGFEDDDVKNLASKYSEKKKNKSSEIDEKLQQTLKENEELKAEKVAIQVEKSVSKTAKELGVTDTNIPYLMKLVSLKDLMDDDNKLNDEKVKTALEKVIADMPIFTTSSDKGIKFGTTDSGKKDDNDDGDSLRKAFGLS